MKKIQLILIVVFLLSFFYNKNVFSQVRVGGEQIIFQEITNIKDVGFGKNTQLSEHLTNVVNGPLVGINGNIVGGYIDNGNKTKDFVNPENYTGNFSVGNGIFGVKKDGVPFLYSFEERKKINTENVQWAFQNGLILVKGEKNIRGNSTSKFPRSGIGYKKDNTILIIVSTIPMTLKNFADLFLFEGCSNAIYLDGGPSYVYFRSESLIFGKEKDVLRLQFYH